jgi:hypothetical protein
VTAALFAIELIEKPNTERSELVSKASKLLSEASGQLKPEETSDSLMRSMQANCCEHTVGWKKRKLGAIGL